MAQQEYRNREDLFKDVVKTKYGYYQLKQKVTAEELALFYAESYYQNDTSVYRKQYAQKELKNKRCRLQRMQKIAERQMQGRDSGKMFLDIGCGEGFALQYFMEQGYDVTGIEYDVHGCEYHNPQVVDKIYKGDSYTVLSQFERQSCSGLILMDNVLEHVLDPECFIQKVTDVARPGTCLIINVPNDFSDTQLMLYEKGKIDHPFWVTVSSYPPEHISYFNKDALEKLLNAYGWSMAYIMGSYPIDFNLFNDHTNYIRNPQKGRDCYETMLEIEALMEELDPAADILTDLYGRRGKAGLGRGLTGFFILR